MMTDQSALSMHDLAAAYALDALDRTEAAAFEQHLEICEACPDAVAEFRDTATTLAGGFHVPPPAGLRDRIMSDAMTSRQDAPRTGRVIDLRAERASRRPRAIAATAVAAALALIVGITSIVIGTRPADDQLDIATVLVAPDVQITPLLGDTEGSVSVAWSEQTGQFVMLARDLPDTGPGQTYELWFIGAGDPQNAGLFDDNDGDAVQIAGDLLGRPAVWAVTIEPEGGSESPTGEILYAGEVTNA